MGVPKDAESAAVGPAVPQGFEGVVDAQVLVVLGDQLDEPLLLGEEGEVLDDVEEPPLLASAPDYRLQGNPALFAFATNLLPL